MRLRPARAARIAATRPRFLTRTGTLSSALALMLLFSVVGAASVPAAGSAGPDASSGRQQAPRTAAHTLERTPATVASAPGRESAVSAAAAASVQPAEATAFAHGFETLPGPWTTWSPSGLTWGQSAFRASEGIYSAYCAGSSIAAPGPYANDMEAWMWTAQPIDLRGLSSPMLSFDIWLDSELDRDTLFVGLSTNDAEGTGDYVGYTFSGNSQGWVTIDIDMTDIWTEYDETLNFAGEPEVWLAFIFDSDASGTAEGAYVDDVRIAETLNPTVDLVEIDGAGRYETAARASEYGWPEGSEVVVLSTGRNWPDALGGATLAGVLDAPILLTARDSIPAVTLAEMDRLQPEHVFILGGTSAVSLNVENQLAARYDNVGRLDGADRYETSWFIAWVATAPTVHPEWDGTVFVATGRNYPDALAASPVAAAHGYPIVLVNPRDLGDTDWFLKEALEAERVVILGGTSAVPTGILHGLQDVFGSANVRRIGGDTRYETAKQIAEYGVSEKGLSYNRLAIATGQNYPDALTGGALQGRHRSVMLLTRSTALSPEPAALLAREKALINEVRFLGGLSSVSQGVRDSVADIFR